MLVRDARGHVLPNQWIVPRTVVLRRQSEHGRIGCGPTAVVRRERSLDADELDELRHRLPVSVALVGLADVRASPQYLLTIRQHLAGRRLVCDERPYLFWMAGHQGERVHGATAGGEDIDRPSVERRDQSMQVVGVLDGRGLGGAIGPLAPLRPTGS